MELQIVSQDKFEYLLLLGLRSEHGTGNAQFPVFGSFEDPDPELAVKENRQCNAWHYTSSRSASRFLEQRTTHEREGYLRFPAPDYQPACVFLLRADRDIVSYMKENGSMKQTENQIEVRAAIDEIEISWTNDVAAERK